MSNGTTKDLEAERNRLVALFEEDFGREIPELIERASEDLPGTEYREPEVETTGETVYAGED